MYIMDVMRYDDVENIASIQRVLNSNSNFGWAAIAGRDFLETEITDALRILIHEECVEVYAQNSNGQLERTLFMPDCSNAYMTGLWYGLLPEGQRRWEAWDPPGEGSK